MIVLNRRRALLFSLAAPLLAAVAGCDPNPNGPTFPTVKPENVEEDAGSDSGVPDSKGKGGRPKKKNATSGIIGDPAA
jgi:hypothetical protein